MRWSRWKRGETRKRAESSRRSGIRCLESPRRLAAYDCRRRDPARRLRGARVQGPALDMVVALMQTELRCPCCGDDLGLAVGRLVSDNGAYAARPRPWGRSVARRNLPRVIGSLQVSSAHS